MKRSLLALLAAAGLTSGCVEESPDLATVTQGVCSFSNKASAPMPAASQWTGTLPGDTANPSTQVWLVLGNDGTTQTPPTTYTVYLVDTVLKKVAWRASITAAQRSTAGALIAARNGLGALGRLPPPPPWPPVDQGVYADRIVDKAVTYRTLLPE